MKDYKLVKLDKLSEEDVKNLNWVMQVTKETTARKAVLDSIVMLRDCKRQVFLLQEELRKEQEKNRELEKRINIVTEFFNEFGKKERNSKGQFV